jgi:hypothetical protein
MIRAKKTKTIIGAAVVIAVVMALVMPISAVDNNVINTKPYERVEIQGVIEKRIMDNTFAEGDVLVTPYIGDDLTPSITRDLAGNVVVSWTNEQSFSESFFGISYSSNPGDMDTWYDNGLVLIISGNDYGFDTALVVGPEPDDYKGLVGVWFNFVDDTAGYYEILDITSDFAEWPIYSWTAFGADSYYSCIADQGFVQGGYYPDMFGPMAFHICLNDLCGNIPQCPVFTHIDIRNDGGGVMFYDCQDDEQTAPAADPDFVAVDDIYHTVVYNVDTNAIIWKKVVWDEEHDYEYTPYQETIATGTNPAIAAVGTNVAVVHTEGGQVKCAYSSDDGENWALSTIGTGSYPDICSVGDTMFATYIDGGNLFLVTSSDYGQTWGAAEQVNQNAGSVVAMENSVDIHSAGIVWTDDRGDDLDLYYATLAGPAPPSISGKAQGKAGDAYEYTFVSSDSTGSDVEYYIEWGDGKVDEWVGPFASGAEAKVSHTWSEQGSYTIRAKARNDAGVESDWATLEIAMPHSKGLFLRFLDLFPNAFPLLRYLLGL